MNLFNRQRSKVKIITALCLSCAFLSCVQNSVFAVPSSKTVEAEKTVISSPNEAAITAYIKLLFKDYKKANRAKNYDEAADYLRSALYFLRYDTNSLEYKEAYSNLKTVLEKANFDSSSENRLETAKNLYLENKLFASAYEFSVLLSEEYEIDLCYEYLGDIAKKIDSEQVALAFYKKAVEINPENLNAKYKYAHSLLKSGKSDEALYYFEDVIEKTNSSGIINEIISIFADLVQKNPDDENNYAILGLAYQKLGKYGETYKLLKKSLMINPEDIFVRYHLGNLLFEINEFTIANEIFSEIIEENPYESQIRIARAKSYGALSEESKSIKDFQVVLAMYPDSLQAQYGLYNLLKEKLPLEKIINLFYPIEPNYKINFEGYNNLGYFANKLGNTNDAVKFFEKSLSLNSKSEIPYIELYKLYGLSGQNSKADDIIKKGYKLFPKNDEILNIYSSLNSENSDEKYNLALSYLNEGEYKKAISVYNQIEPKTASVYEAIGTCYRQLGDYKNSVANYKKSIELNPDNSETYYALGIAYIEANSLKSAKEAFKKSLQKNNSNAKAKQMLSYIEQKEIGKNIDSAYASYEKKDYSSALRQLSAALQSYPNDPKLYYYRGLTKFDLKDYDGAVSDFKKTVSLDRNFTDAYYNLAEALEKTDKQKEALYMYEKYLGAENNDSELAKKAEQKVIELGERYY